MSEHYRLHVNGADHDVADAWIGENLLYVLRERLGLSAAKGACEQGECGSCSVLVDGAAGVRVPRARRRRGRPADRHRRRARRAAARPPTCSGRSSMPVPCSAASARPGLIIAAHDLLDRNPEPSEIEIREELSGNVCRCTGYGRIIEAVQQVAVARRKGGRR